MAKQSLTRSKLIKKLGRFKGRAFIRKAIKSLKK